MEAEIPLHTSPGDLLAAPGFGSLWVENTAENAADRIDAGTNKVVAKIPVSAGCDGVGVGFGSVWVPDCTNQLIARIDPTTNTVSGSIDISVCCDKQIAVGERAVWMPVASDLMRIDPRTMMIVGKVPIDPGLAQAVVGFGSVWVTSPVANKVFRVDPDTMKVIATVHVSGANFIAAGEGAIWTLNNGDGGLSRIDPGTNTVVAKISSGATGSAGMAVGLGSVWVSADAMPLAQIDAHTNEVVATYTTDFGANTVAVGLGSVWLPSPGFDAMWRLRPGP